MNHEDPPAGVTGEHPPLDRARLGGPLTARVFFDACLRVTVDRRLVPLTLHSEQARVIAAWDTLAPTGLPVYTELLLSWIKKAGKSATVAGLGLCELVAGADADREVIIASSGLLQSRDVVLAAMVRFVRRDPWLSKHVRCLATELIFEQMVVDPRTGGRHRQEHIAKAVARRTQGHYTAVMPPWSLLMNCGRRTTTRFSKVLLRPRVGK